MFSYFAVCNGRHNALRYSISLLKYKTYEVNIALIRQYVGNVRLWTVKSTEVN